MAKATVAAQLKNFDHHLVRVEQILPSVATKEDLRRAIEPLATKEDLRRAVEPLATRVELREIRDELRRHTDLRFEALHSSIELLAAHLVRIATNVYGE